MANSISHGAQVVTLLPLRSGAYAVIRRGRMGRVVARMGKHICVEFAGGVRDWWPENCFKLADV